MARSVMDDLDPQRQDPPPRGARQTAVARIRRILTGRIARTAGWLSLLKLVRLLNSLIIGIWLARYLGPADYGVYTYVISLSLALAPISSFGLTNTITKEIKLGPQDEGRILGTATAMRIFGAVVVVIVSVMVAANSSLPTEDLAWLTAVFAASGVIGVFYYLEYYFLAKEKMDYFVKYSIPRVIFFALLKVAAILGGFGLETMVYVAAIETAGSGLASLSAYIRGGGAWRDWRFDSGLARVYIRRSAPLIASGLSAAVYLKIDVLFLAEMRGAAEAGIYAVAARLSEIWFILPPIVTAAAFPRLLELRRDKPALYLRRLQDMFDALAAAATGVALGMTFVATPVILALFGDAYAAAAGVLVVHVWSCVFSFQRALLSKWFVAEDLYTLSLWNNLLGAAVNVVLNLILIPPYGAVGAAVATLISYATASMGGLAFTSRGRPVALMMVKSLFWPVRLPRLIRSLKG